MPYASRVTASMNRNSLPGACAAVATKRAWTVFMGSEEELHRRQRRVAVQQVHALEGHAQATVAQREVVQAGADVELQLVALRFGVVELGAHDEAVAVRVELLDRRRLQQVVRAAGRLLRERPRALQPLDAQLAQQLVFV